MLIKPIKLAPAREQVAQSLRQAILAGEYRQGELISLDSVAHLVGVSRTPVREAFQLLAAEGLIELRPNRGAVVIGLAPEAVADSFDMRILLEGEAVYRACMNGVDTKLLERYCDEGDLAVKYNEVARFTKCNMLFHETIWEASGSEKLKGFLRQLWKGLMVDQAVDKKANMAEAQEEHKELLAVLKEHDATKARQVMRQHLLCSKINALNSLTKKNKSEAPRHIGNV